METLRIALACTVAPVSDNERNLAHSLKWCRSAGEAGADIICFPEAGLTGYWPDTQAAAIALDIPGPETTALTDIAVEHDMAVLAGAIEKNGCQKPFLTHVAAVTGALHVYRKAHIAPFETRYFSAGETALVFDFKGFKIGIQLCYDAHFPEFSTTMALKGVDMIFMPHASPNGTPQEKAVSWGRHLSARAFDNGIFVAAVNQCGDNGKNLSFPGLGMVFGPDGHLIRYRYFHEDGLLIADISKKILNAVRTHPMKYFIPCRRPELYASCR